MFHGFRMVSLLAQEVPVSLLMLASTPDPSLRQVTVQLRPSRRDRDMIVPDP